MENEYNIRGPELSHYIMKKARFVQAMQDHDIDQEKGQKIWDWLSQKTDEKYDAYLLSQGEPEVMTWEKLAELELDPTEFYEFCQSIGLDLEKAEGLFQVYEGEVRTMFGNDIEAREEAQHEVQQREEVRQAEQAEGELSVEQIDQIISDVRQDPKHPYNDPNASQEAHDKAVNGMNKLLEMKAGLIPRTMGAIDGYAKEFKTDQEQLLKDQYGVSGSLYKSGDYHSAYTPKREVEDGDKDDIAQDQDEGVE